MKSLAPQLHIVLGSVAAMLVAFLALLNGTSPSTCIIKAITAFLVFAGFGLVLRYALADVIEADSAKNRSDTGSLGAGRNGDHGLDVIVPGTSVADVLASHAPAQEPDLD